MMIFLISDGSLWKDYTFANFPDCPYNGIHGGWHCEDGKLYGGFTFTAEHGQAEYRGLCVIDLNTDVFTIVRPPYASIDNYGFTGIICRGEPKQLLICAQTPYSANEWGIAKYNASTGAWAYLNQYTVARVGRGLWRHGLFPDLLRRLRAPDHGGDAVRIGASQARAFLSMFSVYGYMKQATQSLGTFSGGAWTFGAGAAAVQEYLDYDMVISADPSNNASMYAFWVHEDPATNEKSISSGTGTLRRSI